MIIRRAVVADIPAICRLLAAIDPHHPKADPAVLRWQYWDVPAGPPASVVAEDPAEGIVGHAGLFAVACQLDGRRVVVGHGADAAVAPGHRGRGLFRALAAARLEAAGEQGYPTMLAWPNLRSRAVDRDAGAAVEIRVAAYVGPRFRPGRGRPTGYVARPRRQVVVSEHAGAPPALDDLASATVGEANAIVRDEAWWHWRYLRRPRASYRFVGATRAGRPVAAAATTVHRVGGRPVTAVLELLATDVAAARRVLAAVRHGMPTAALAVLAVPGTRAARLARACGLVRVPRLLEPSPLVLSIATRPDPQMGRRAAAGDWYVSWGDHDHV